MERTKKTCFADRLSCNGNENERMNDWTNERNKTKKGNKLSPWVKRQEIDNETHIPDIPTLEVENRTLPCKRPIEADTMQQHCRRLRRQEIVDICKLSLVLFVHSLTDLCSNANRFNLNRDHVTELWSITCLYLFTKGIRLAVEDTQKWSHNWFRRIRGGELTSFYFWAFAVV